MLCEVIHSVVGDDLEMNETSAVSTSWERAQKLYDKNVELKNKRMNSVQAKVPSDPNSWYHMRDNLEEIILEDYPFSEQHNIELELWQMHYKRIEEFRVHFSAAQASGRSRGPGGGKNPPHPDRVMKIRVQLKAFLSEATGFYHDLILKIKAKYGLPLGFFSDDSDNLIDGVKSSELKKGLMSCHRSLIYLGDLARYKGMYGEGESKNCDYAAASSYYLQAASLYPSSGNPHHQLAILASYSGDELAVVYRYFRSLAAEISFLTAKDNLVVAFEKNRQRYSQLAVNAKPSPATHSGAKATNGDLRKEAKLKYEGANERPGHLCETSSSPKERYKDFSIKFVRLNGMLFTRASLEMFTEVLSSVRSALDDLLSFGSEELQSVGADAAENRLTILRLIAILIFTINNVNKKSEGLSFAEVLQHKGLIQNAFTAAFELVGNLLERCIQLQDPSSSYLLPGILVFLEWVACCPDVVSTADTEERTLTAKSYFWKHCLALLNKLLSLGLTSVDDDGDETCFTNMSRYEDGGSETQLALWEDFELRGFLPLVPAHAVLDFSRKHPVSTEGKSKERKTRLKRLVAVGKALASVAMVDQKPVYYDSKVKRFVIGFEPKFSKSSKVSTYVGAPPSVSTKQEIPQGIMNMGIMQTKGQFLFEGEEEDEEIVFKPMPTDRPGGTDAINWALNQNLELGQRVSSASNVQFPQTTSDARLEMTVPASNFTPQQHVINTQSTAWLMQQQPHLVNGLSSLSFVENGHKMKPESRGGFDISHVTSSLPSIQHPTSFSNSALYGQGKTPEINMPSKADAVVYSNSDSGSSTLTGRATPTLSAASRSQVIRPGRHHGPPPGFSPVPPKQSSVLGSDLRNENSLVDECSWFDGLSPSLSNGPRPKSSVNFSSYGYTQIVNNGNNMIAATIFPFPGKQYSTGQVPVPMGSQNVYRNPNLIHDIKFSEQQHMVTGNQQFSTLPEQYQGKSDWTGHYLV